MLKRINKDYLVKALLLIMVPSLLYSRAVTTICIILLFVLACIYSKRPDWNGFFRDRHFALFALVFLGVLVSGINSENGSAWLQHCNMKLPFVVLPISFYLLPRFTEEWVFQIHRWLLVVMVLASLPVSLQYFLDPPSAINAISIGQAIQTPVEHVKYSMMNAYAVISGMVCLKRMKKRQGPWILFLILTAWLFFYMHLLAVRTGLLIVYICAVAILFIWIKDRVAAFATAMALLAILYISVQTIPTLNQKWGYMRYDWQMMSEGRGINYSDSDRLTTFRAGLDLFRSMPLMGTGIGDLRASCIELYTHKYERPGFQKMPHNQFLYLAAGSGILGLGFFLVGFYGPLFRSGFKAPLLLVILYLIYTLSFAVENSLERSFSVAFFLLFALLWISVRRKKAIV